MKTPLLILSMIAVVLLGCQKPPEATPEEGTSPVVQSDATGIAPMTTAPIPNAPIAGAESVQGGGSGVGSVMKDRARGIGAGGAPSSLDQMGTGE